ncbi:Hypothetical predicted protein [Mytilus galloprovincialis]|uniref:Uncharacterized protein n=1 Tax=Mytilus galloprovincialis TaxID=29158 RepID=A0A8B6C3X6_MYTGA|nr:Hypothetical predicted protein [Mytilus galloprovincialis]
MRTRQNNARRQNLADTVLRNSLTYEAIILELLKRRLGITRQQSMVTNPVTVSLPDNFIQENVQTNRNKHSHLQTSWNTRPPAHRTRTARPPTQTFWNTRSPTQTFRNTQPPTQTFKSTRPPAQSRNTIQSTKPPPQTALRNSNNNQFTGTPIHLKSKLSHLSGQSSSVRTNTTVQTKNTQSKQIYNGIISLRKNGGFEFQSPNGVRLSIPNNSGKLILRPVADGVELNYVTPIPTRPTMPFEEEEFEF